MGYKTKLNLSQQIYLQNQKSPSQPGF